MKIFITGHKGFIGTHLYNRLVTCNQIEGYDLKDGSDIRDCNKLRSRMMEFMPEVVIHLAAKTGVRDSFDDSDNYLTTNINGTFNVLRVARECGAQRILVASSSSVYGTSPFILKEGEEAFSMRRSIYAVSKYAMEDMCRYYSGMFDIETIVFRPFTVYGTKGREDMVVMKAIRAAIENKPFEVYGDGEQSRAFTHVDDLIDGLELLLNYYSTSGLSVFNIGGSDVYTINDLIEIIKGRFNNFRVNYIERKKEDVLHSEADLGKMSKERNYKPKRDFKKEINKIINYETKIVKQNDVRSIKGDL